MRWEYKIESFYKHDRKTLLAHFNQRGKEGWELVERTPEQWHIRLTWKRRILSRRNISFNYIGR